MNLHFFFLNFLTFFCICFFFCTNLIKFFAVSLSDFLISHLIIHRGNLDIASLFFWKREKRIFRAPCRPDYLINNLKTSGAR